MDATARLKNWLDDHPRAIYNVVDLDPAADRLLKLDLTAANAEIAPFVADIPQLTALLNKKMAANNCRYAIGGYLEHRTIYKGIALFETGGEPRLLHLGVDIWADAGTPVYAPLPGTIHSFNDNNNPGDYGPAIILEHKNEGLTFYSLYGHLSRKDLDGLSIGKPINGGEVIGHFGTIDENGYWPPHLHFQLMLDMEGNYGDYPGACRFSDKEKYLKNIADPYLLLQIPEEAIIN